jgi:hypothetical protein
MTGVAGGGSIGAGADAADCGGFLTVFPGAAVDRGRERGFFGRSPRSGFCIGKLIYIHILNRSGLGVRSPLDAALIDPDAGSAV